MARNLLLSKEYQAGFGAGPALQPTLSLQHAGKKSTPRLKIIRRISNQAELLTKMLF